MKKKQDTTRLKSFLGFPFPVLAYGPVVLSSFPLNSQDELYILSFRDFTTSQLQTLSTYCFLCLHHFFPTSLPSGFKSHLKCHFLRETFSDIPNEAKVKCFHSSLQFSILILLNSVIVYSVSNQILRGYDMDGYRVKQNMQDPCHPRSYILEKGVGEYNVHIYNSVYWVILLFHFVSFYSSVVNTQCSISFWCTIYSTVLCTAQCSPI